MFAFLKKLFGKKEQPVAQVEQSVVEAPAKPVAAKKPRAQPKASINDGAITVKVKTERPVAAKKPTAKKAPPKKAAK